LIHVGPVERDEAADIPGWSTFTLPFVATGAARDVLLGFGTDVEVLAPLSLRQEFAQTAAAILRLYKE